MKHTVPTISRRTFLTGTASVAGLSSVPGYLHGTTTEDPLVTSPYTLHFAQPASKWPNALPVGNGRLGAMVFGGVTNERIQLNEESIWDGEPNRDRNNPRAKAAIPRIRELLFAGQIAEAEELAISDVLSIPRRMPCYQTLGDLHLDFSWMGPGQDAVPEDYRLQLDLDSGIAQTSFSYRGTSYRREVFSSAPDQVIVVRVTASKPGSIGLRATLDRPHSFSVETPSADRLVLTGQALPVNDNPGLPDKEHQTGVRFHAEVRALATGGVVRAAASGSPGLGIEHADAVTLLIDCATSYRYPARAGKASGIDADVLVGDPAAMRAAVTRNISGAAHRSYAELRERHLADHRRYSRRVSFSLGPDPNAAVPTDVRMQRVKAGADDVQLIPIYFQFGRYMLLSSSRPGTLAANLQGIWNESVDPPWGSKYTVNINAEMNYWFANAANLSECHLPLFDLLDATRSQGSVTARELYGARGSVVHHNTDIWGDSGPIDGLGGGLWAMGANWLSLHLWTHYQYTGDRRFLLERAYPALRERATFLLDYLVKDPVTGLLTSGPSCSPENAYEVPGGKSHNLCMGPTMDISITRAVFARLLDAAHELHGEQAVTDDSDLHRRVREAWSGLPPFRVGHDGRLQEWEQDYADHEPGHRHISHLFGLFPEDQITLEATPELAKAARRTLDVRLANGSGSTGWSRSWIINCMARLGDGEACHANLLALFRQCTRPNLFDVCGLKENSPFQIDGNLGAPSGVIEMLVQSHGVTPLKPRTSGDQQSDFITLRILPALPSAWSRGSAKGLRARGGLELDLEWEQGRAATAILRASLKRRVRIIPPPGQTVTGIAESGRNLNVADPLSVRAGGTYTIHFG